MGLFTVRPSTILAAQHIKKAIQVILEKYV